MNPYWFWKESSATDSYTPPVESFINQLLKHQPCSNKTPEYTHQDGKFLKSLVTVHSNYSMTQAQDFFAAFEDFDYDETALLIDEFHRLAISRQWGLGSRKFRKQRQKCFEQAFDKHFGAAEKTLQGWQDLCQELSINPPPSSITRCKKVRPAIYRRSPRTHTVEDLSRVFVNIVDLIEARRLGLAPRIFSSRASLRRYSRETGKMFSKRKAKADGYLSILLIHMF